MGYDYIIWIFKKQGVFYRLKVKLFRLGKCGDIALRYELRYRVGKLEIVIIFCSIFDNSGIDIFLLPTNF